MSLQKRHSTSYGLFQRYDTVCGADGVPPLHSLGVVPPGSEMIEEDLYEDGSKTVRTFDEGGRVIKLVDLDTDGRVSMEVSYTYDLRGNNVEQVVTDEKGLQIRGLAFQFLDDGRARDYEEFDDKNRLVHRIAG